MGRPLGSFGEISRALLAAAADRPGTALELAARAQVGRRAARYTASRLVTAGRLQVLKPGRPAVLGLAESAVAPPSIALAAALAGWGRSE